MKVRARIFNISFICVYAPVENTEKERMHFMRNLNSPMIKILAYDVMLKDTKGAVGMEEAFRPKTGPKSIGERSTEKGNRSGNFALVKKLDNY